MSWNMNWGIVLLENSPISCNTKEIFQKIFDEHVSLLFWVYVTAYKN